MFRKKVFGLDISDHSVEVMLLKQRFFGKIKIVSYGRSTYAANYFVNGVIKNPDKLAEIIKKTLGSGSPKKIKTPYCIVTIPQSMVFTTVFQLPAGLTKKELKNTIPLKAEELLPFKTKEVYYDYQAVEKNGPTQDVLYVAVPADVIESYSKLTEKCGLVPLAFDVEPLTLSRSLMRSYATADLPVIIADIGSRSSQLIVFDKGIRHLATVPVAGNRLTKVVMQASGSTEKESEKLKQSYGLDDKKQAKKVVNSLGRELQKIAKPITALARSFKKGHDKEISRVILAGGTAQLKGIDRYLSKAIGIKTEVADPFSEISNSDSIFKSREVSPLFANVTGAALRGVEKNPAFSSINLLPLEPQRLRFAPPFGNRFAWVKIFVRLAILLVLICVLVALLMQKKNNRDFYADFFGSFGTDQEFYIGESFNVDNLQEASLRENVNETTTTATTTPVIEQAKRSVTINDTGIGYLNVRSGPGTNFEKIAEAQTGETYEVIGIQDGWYQIKFNDEIDGWVFSQYVEESIINE